MPSKKIFQFLIGLSVILFIICNVYFFRQAIKPRAFPALGQVKNFHLTDSKGNPFTLDYLQGRVWIASFFFTTCSDICPLMNKHMAALHRTFDKVNGVRLVSITVNPEYDSSDVLTAYAKKYQANPEKWIFLTGSREEITRLAVQSFRMGSMEEPVFHSSYFALVDRHGFIRGYYDGTNQEGINKLFKDTSTLIIER
jgi:protein SCO1/2